MALVKLYIIYVMKRLFDYLSVYLYYLFYILNMNLCPTDGTVQADTSFESGVSDDYAIPPDALSSDATSVESSLLLLRTSTCMDSPGGGAHRRPESLEKCGHLAKLGGKLKTWRKRWFLLRNGVLTYWKSQVSSSIIFYLLGT